MKKLDAALVAYALIAACVFALLYWIWQVSLDIVSKL